MDFDTLLQTLEDNGTEKTAAAPQGQGPDKALQEALKQTLTKTASAPAPATASSNPIDDLEKLAEEIAGTEKEAELIHATNMGRAFADAAIEQFSSMQAKMAQVESLQPVVRETGVSQQEVNHAVKVAAEQGYADAQEAVIDTAFREKIASASPEETTELIKVAQEAGRDDLLVKAAADQGYRETQEKIAAAHYAQGESDALAEVHNLASAEFIKGAQEANILIERARANSQQ